MGFFKKFKEAWLASMTFDKLDDDFYEELEEALILADIGAATAADTVEQLRRRVSQKLMTQRYHGDESKKDVHEKDVEYLARSRRAAEFCAAHLGWQTVPCTCGDGMRSIEEIGQEVRRRVDAAFAE